MLAKEIIHQIKTTNIGRNVIIKLDMAKAYDRVSWSYIWQVLRKMVFAEVFIDMVWRIIANIRYSIIVSVRDMVSFSPPEVSTKVIHILRPYFL